MTEGTFALTSKIESLRGVHHIPTWPSNMFSPPDL